MRTTAQTHNMRSNMAYGVVGAFGAILLYVVLSFLGVSYAKEVLSDWHAILLPYSSRLLLGGAGAVLIISCTVIMGGWYKRRKSGTPTKQSFIIVAVTGAVLICGGALPFCVTKVINRHATTATYVTTP